MNEEFNDLIHELEITCGNLSGSFEWGSGRSIAETEYSEARKELDEAIDKLLTRAERAESIINGMFPLWIAAMSYCEHGKAADLNRMRNYYNGRDNPLTAEELQFLFSLIPEKTQK